MIETRYLFPVSLELVEAAMRGRLKPCKTDFPEDAVVVGARESLHMPTTVNIVVSIPSMEYNRQEMEDLQIYGKILCELEGEEEQ